MQPLSHPPQVILPLRAQQQQPRLPQRQGAAEVLEAGRAVWKLRASLLVGGCGLAEAMDGLGFYIWGINTYLMPRQNGHDGVRR